MGKSKAHVIYRNDEGQIVPGASTIAKLAGNPQSLINWANKMGLAGIDSTKYRDDKADIGTLAHKMILDYFRKEETDTSDYTANQIDAAENSLLSFYEWEKGHKLEPIIIEEPLVCKTFGGTPDFYGVNDGEFELIDFKTGRGIYREHWYQVAGYYKLLQVKNVKPLPINRVRILNIPRSEDESFKEEVNDMTVVEKYLEGFLRLVEFYHIDKRIK